MKRFIYSAVEGEDLRLEAEGDIGDILSAIGEMLGTLYSSYSRHDPSAADMFKFGIEQLVNNPMAPAWKVEALPDGGVEIFTQKPKEDAE